MRVNVSLQAIREATSLNISQNSEGIVIRTSFSMDGDFLNNVTYFPPTLNGCLLGFTFLKKTNQNQNILVDSARPME
jgi:hypothetical protein